MIFDYIKDRMQITNGFVTKFKYENINVIAVFNEQWYEKGMYILSLKDDNNSLIMGQPLVALNEKRIDFNDRYNINGGDVSYFQSLLFPQLTEQQIINGENPSAKYWYLQCVGIIGDYQKLDDRLQQIKDELFEQGYGASFLESPELYLNKVEHKMITNEFKIQLNYDFGISFDILDELQTLGATITVTSNKAESVYGWYNNNLQAVNRINRPQEIINLYESETQEVEQSTEEVQYDYEQPVQEEAVSVESEQGESVNVEANETVTTETVDEQPSVEVESTPESTTTSTDQSIEDIFNQPFDSSVSSTEEQPSETTSTPDVIQL